MMVDLKRKIEEVAVPLLNAVGAFIVDIHVVPGDRRKIIQLFVDTDSGITIEKCAEISRQLGTAIEMQNVIPNSYVLQVSSPGLKKSLKILRQYKKNIGREFRVRFRQNEGIVEILAKLIALEGEILTFVANKNETYTVSFSDIIESVEDLPW